MSEFITSSACTFATDTLMKSPTGVSKHSVLSALQTYYLDDILRSLCVFGFNPCLSLKSFHNIDCVYEAIGEYFRGQAKLNANDKDFIAMYSKSTTFFHRTLVLYTQYIKLDHIQTDNEKYLKNTFHFNAENIPHIKDIKLPHTFYNFINTIVNLEEGGDIEPYAEILTSLDELSVFQAAQIKHKKSPHKNLSDDYDDIISAINNNNEQDKQMSIVDQQQHDILLTLYSIAIHNIHPDIFHKEGITQIDSNTTKMTKIQMLDLFKRVLKCSEKHNPTILPTTENR